MKDKPLTQEMMWPNSLFTCKQNHLKAPLVDAEVEEDVDDEAEPVEGEKDESRPNSGKESVPGEADNDDEDNEEWNKYH